MEPEDALSHEDNDDVVTCPLFMQGLPLDFAANPGLAALASLLEEGGETRTTTKDSDDGSDPKPKMLLPPTKRGGGKLTRGRGQGRKHRQNAPYKSPPLTSSSSKKNQETATLGEAQLFMKMWKL